MIKKHYLQVSAPTRLRLKYLVEVDQRYYISKNVIPKCDLRCLLHHYSKLSYGAIALVREFGDIIVLSSISMSDSVFLDSRRYLYGSGLRRAYPRRLNKVFI